MLSNRPAIGSGLFAYLEYPDMTQTGPINARQTAQQAIKAGLLIPSGGEGGESKCPPWPEPTADWSAMRAYFEGKVKTPQEAGIAAPILPPPKTDHRKGLRLRPLKPNHRPRYVITKSQAIAQGIKLP